MARLLASQMKRLGREQFRSAVLRYVELPGAKFFRAIKFTPNGITILGFLITVVSAYLVGAGWLLAGGIVFLFAGGLDLMDGALARLTDRVSPFGALLDSVFDRLSEAPKGQRGPGQRLGTVGTPAGIEAAVGRERKACLPEIPMGSRRRSGRGVLRIMPPSGL